MSAFGEALRAARLGRGLSVTEVARMLDISAAYVSDVELGKRSAFHDVRTILVSRAYNLDPLPMLAAAGAQRGYNELRFYASHAQSAARIVAVWEGLTGKQAARLADAAVEMMLR